MWKENGSFDEVFLKFYISVDSLYGFRLIFEICMEVGN